jgi:hypothetical protein
LLLLRIVVNFVGEMMVASDDLQQSSGGWAVDSSSDAIVSSWILLMNFLLVRAW